MEPTVDPIGIPDLAKQAKEKEKREKKEKKKKDKLNKKELTIHRVIFAQERTLSAWVRTGASFVTFGFALYKLLDAAIKDGRRTPILGVIGPREIGITLISMGWLGVILGVIRYYQTMKILRNFTTIRHIPVSLIQAYVIIALTSLLLYAAIFRQ